jgi:hypothetical protein
MFRLSLSISSYVPGPGLNLVGDRSVGNFIAMPYFGPSDILEGISYVPTPGNLRASLDASDLLCSDPKAHLAADLVVAAKLGL